MHVAGRISNHKEGFFAPKRSGTCSSHDTLQIGMFSYRSFCGVEELGIGGGA